VTKREIYTPDFPEITMPSTEIYGSMGEQNIRAMITDFYKELHASSIQSIFKSDIQTGTDRSAWFFIEILGGPDLFQQNRGAPRMRARHIPFQITESQRQVWLSCFMKVLSEATEKYSFPPHHLECFKKYLVDFSGWMVSERHDWAEQVPS
jgi:hemoglobin